MLGRFFETPEQEYDDFEEMRRDAIDAAREKWLDTVALINRSREVEEESKRSEREALARDSCAEAAEQAAWDRECLGMLPVDEDEADYE